MSSPAQWFETCIGVLKGLNAQLGNRHDTEALYKDLGYRTTEEGEVLSRKIQYNSEMDPCNPSDLNSYKCALFTPIKEDKIVPNEFYYQKPDSKTPVPIHYVDVFYKNCTFRGKYACGNCFFKARIAYLLERIDYAPVEIILDIASSSANQTFSFVGIRTKVEKEVKDTFLALNFSTKANEKSKEEVKKTYIVSYLKNALEFIEVKNVEGLYYLVQDDTLNLIDNDFPNISLIEIDKLYFINDFLDISSIRSEFNVNIKSAFEISFPKNQGVISLQKGFLKIKPKPESEEEKKKDLDNFFIKSLKYIQKFNFKTLSDYFTITAFKVFFCIAAGILLVLIFREFSRTATPLPPPSKTVKIL